MAKKARRTETVKVSRLGCMRKSTVETDMTGRTVEHVEVWTTKKPATRKKRSVTGDEQ